jgi:hypothetical protein
VGAEDSAGSDRTPLGPIGVFLSVAALTACLTLLFLGMRSVMRIGGFCAEGGPFVIAHHCPKGIPGIMIGSIWGGLIFAGVYIWQAAKHDVAPSLIGLAWPALFLSLGWNFFEFGFRPPGGSGIAWGWIVPGILFALMGGIPLIFVILYAFRREAAPAPSRPIGGPLRTAAASVAALAPLRSSQGTARSDDLVAQLERLDVLHRSGGLDDAEYHAAKRRLLEERP